MKTKVQKVLNTKKKYPRLRVVDETNKKTSRVKSLFFFFLYIEPAIIGMKHGKLIFNNVFRDSNKKKEPRVAS
jgi:hypothetical protein